MAHGVQASSHGAAQPAASSHHRRRRRDQGPLDQHINKPLRQHEWASKDRRWTRRDLDKERTEFFDTRVTGRPEIWQTIHAALQVLWDPATEDSNDDGLNGLGTAQSILSAAEISLPTGDLANGVYDSLGNYYQLPQWVVADPTNLADESDPDGKGGDLSTGAGETIAADFDDMPADDAERRREEKGKRVLDAREQIKVRARLSDSGRDIEVSVGKTDPVRSVIRTIASESATPSTKKIRIAYMGKMLKEGISLEDQGWQTDHIVNALVFNR
ncbi:ubiquitin supergroup [Purpureocillium lilacinum]|uniref:Ubiquitin supergroup n=1 Tax=Purpureocillium lilacinum TaxID=33203 RepID=A0A179GTW4_PURLI|nr:ubiquitin supergroup [Purpureocillium lilacinum]